MRYGTVRVVTCRGVEPRVVELAIFRAETKPIRKPVWYASVLAGLRR